MKCNWCSTLIFFNTGEKIPREIDTGVMHKCILRPHGKLPCLYCGKDIFFSPFVTSRSGKPIPLSVASGGGKHRCAARPFNRDTRHRWWQEQNAKAEAERERKRRAYEEYKHKSKEEYSRRHRQQRNSWTSDVKQQEYAKILGVPLSATNEQIKQAYRRMILQYHPDRNHSDQALEMSKKLNEAYANFSLRAK
jgi:hypothetical protein